MKREADSEPILVPVSAGYLGDKLHNYVMGLPPMLRGTEIARLAFSGYKRERGGAKRGIKVGLSAGPAVIEMIGRKIKWVG